MDEKEFPDQLNVRITDIDLPFGAMVGLMIQVALAAIPAVIVLGIALKVLGLAWDLFLALVAKGTH